MIIDEKNQKNGVVELRPIDALRIRKVRQVIQEKDPKSGANLVKGYNEFYIYQDQEQNKANTGLKINKDSIVYVPSGVVDSTSKKVISYLYKAIKPVNQLRMMEDSLVIYRLARAPERRIFYIDVGNLPKGKAEGYLRDIMARYKIKSFTMPTLVKLKTIVNICLCWKTSGFHAAKVVRVLKLLHYLVAKT